MRDYKSSFSSTVTRGPNEAGPQIGGLMVVEAGIERLSKRYTSVSAAEGGGRRSSEWRSPYKISRPDCHGAGLSTLSKRAQSRSMRVLWDFAGAMA